MKILEIYNKLIDEITDDQYELVGSKYSNSRIIMTSDDEINYNPTLIQGIGPKPKGLWYGIGLSWIKWVKREAPEWEKDNIFILDIDESRVKLIRDFEGLVEFDKEYGVESERYRNWRSIDWGKVASDWGGIEIAPHIYKGVRDISWYWGWDVASGCIWGNNVIKGLKRL